MKIKSTPNENLIHIIDYINNDPHIITWKELIQMAFDYECYKELYSNHFVIKELVNEHNFDVEKKEVEKVENGEAW